MKFNRNSYTFIEENAYENVFSQMATILPRPQYINKANEVCGGVAISLNWSTEGQNVSNQRRLIWCDVMAL